LSPRRNRPAAYEKLVDRLLPPPLRRAPRALLARLGPLCRHPRPLQGQFPQQSWPFRDYVIAPRSIRTSRSTQFVAGAARGGSLSHPAGESAWSPPPSSGAAVTTEEGGSILQELRVNNQRERTEMFGAILSRADHGSARSAMTISSTPSRQRDFYRLAAFFNNQTGTAQAMTSRSDWPPNIRLPEPANRRRLQRRPGPALRRRPKSWTPATGEAADLIADLAPAPAGTSRGPVSSDGMNGAPALRRRPGSVLHNGAPNAAFATVTATQSAPIWGEETWLWPCFHMEVGTQLALPQPVATGRVISPSPSRCGSCRIGARAANRPPTARSSPGPGCPGLGVELQPPQALLPADPRLVGESHHGRHGGAGAGARAAGTTSS